jgi:sporulation integral membrane protein YtvI
MLSFYKRYWRTAFDIALIALTVYLIMYAFSFLYRIATPIFFALIIFICIEPLAAKLNKWGVKKSIASGISIILFTLLILGAFTGAGIIVTKQGTALANNFPEYQKVLTQQIDNLTIALEKQFDKLPEDFDLAQSTKDFLEKASSKIGAIAQSVFMGIVGYVSSISTFVFNLVVGVILAYFLSIEITVWRKTATEKTPKTFKAAFMFLRENVFKGIGSYIKAQAKMITVTFLVILVALIALGVDNAFVIALVAGIFDVLPLLGVSTLFVPWIIYLFIVGQTTLAIWLSLLLLVVILTRQILEPKITGDSLGVSAFTMLAFMIVSLSLFGIAGVILSPILVILIKSLYVQGYFKMWIRKPIDEYDEHVEPAAATGSPPPVSVEETPSQSFLERLKRTPSDKKKEDDGENNKS